MLTRLLDVTTLKNSFMFYPSSRPIVSSLDGFLVADLAIREQQIPGPCPGRVTAQTPRRQSGARAAQ